ncbi:MAG: 3-carboxy-cis,cis-muconate cycloisomerase [Litoreibacter sp.]
MTSVFEDRWLGGLFADAGTARIWSPQQQLKHMLSVEAAFTRALGSVGSIPVDDAKRIAAQIERFQVDVDDLRLGTARDGLPVPALVAQLKTMAGPYQHAVHAGLTSQDVMDTALTLTLQAFNSCLFEQLSKLIQGLAGLSERFGAHDLIGRTRMQAALPIKVSDRIKTWSEPLKNHLQRLEKMRGQIEVLQFGGAVGNDAALKVDAPAVRANMAVQLGLRDPMQSWHTMRDGLADYANLLSLVTGSVGKMGQDICLMAQQGIDEITLSEGGGSSAMPHKQNPVLAELLVTLARYNATQLSGMHHTLVHEQERSGSAWMLEWMILPDMAQTTAGSLSAAADICIKITDIGTQRR